ncbi:MAG: response regulator [Anaerolineae bacterium]|jgi:CheY-like chemotaxis protein|nr:response regulator [Anaerolineae bacterium]
MYRILHIEDNIYNSRLVKKMVKPMGYDIIDALDAASGLRAARYEKPDIILMDVSLPDMNGYDATRELKATPELAHIPIIILTADTTDRVKNACLAAGCDAYLNKPVSRTHLLRTIQQVCHSESAAS